MRDDPKASLAPEVDEDPHFCWGRSRGVSKAESAILYRVCGSVVGISRMGAQEGVSRPSKTDWKLRRSATGREYIKIREGKNRGGSAGRLPGTSSPVSRGKAINGDASCEELAVRITMRWLRKIVGWSQNRFKNRVEREKGGLLGGESMGGGRGAEKKNEEGEWKIIAGINS